MDIEKMSIEKATERCNQLIKPEHANWIGISNQVAMIRVLNELEKKDKVINEMAIVIDGEDEVLYCTRMSHIKDNYCNTRNCTDCIIEYFTNKVEREGK